MGSVLLLVDTVYGGHLSLPLNDCCVYSSNLNKFNQLCDCDGASGMSRDFTKK